MQIASLLPSATEIVCALGLSDALVGVSHACDFPSTVVGRPVLTEPKIDPCQRSGGIDESVRALVRDGLSIFRIKTDVLERLQPDLIVTQEQCAVCAVSSADIAAAARQLLRRAATIVSLRPALLGDIFNDIQRIADAARRPAAGTELSDRLRARLDAIRVRAQAVRSRPRVACLEWLDPLMAAGNWVPEMVQLAGGTYDLAACGAPSPTIGWDALVAYAPDVVILMPCGFTLAQTQRELPSLLAHPQWSALPAVHNRRVYAVDGNAYLNRPGPRIVESAELLAGLIQPSFFATAVPPDSYIHVS